MFSLKLLQKYHFYTGNVNLNHYSFIDVLKCNLSTCITGNIEINKTCGTFL